MKPIPLKQLLDIAPLEKATKEKILNSLPNINERQKFELTKMCWDAISLMFQSQVKTKHDQMFREMKSGESVYNKQDFQSVEKEIFNKFLVKIDETQSQEEAQAIKAKLKTPPSPPPVQ
jgi:hypothetical protein